MIAVRVIMVRAFILDISEFDAPNISGGMFLHSGKSYIAVTFPGHSSSTEDESVAIIQKLVVASQDKRHATCLSQLWS